MEPESYENFLIAPKGKTQVNIRAFCGQGILNPDYALESPGELLKNTDARVPPQFKSEGRGSNIGVGTEERERGHPDVLRGRNLLPEVTCMQEDIHPLDDVTTWQAQVLYSLGARLQFKKAHCFARVMLF